MISRKVIASSKDALFYQFWNIYESSFSLSQRRANIEEQERIFQLDNYTLDIWYENDVVFGFIGWWQCDDKCKYIEHFAIDSAYRSLGHGSKFIREWIADNDSLVLLEIEPIIDKITCQRLHFYERLGFIKNNIIHSQPPYNVGMEAIDLEILSYPKIITKDIYILFAEKQKNEIIGAF